MLVVTRYRVPAGQAVDFEQEAATAMTALTGRTGFLDGWLGRNADDPELWTLTLLWRDVGSYRRALSSYDVKITTVPLLSRALDEPSAYEVMASWAAASGENDATTGR